MKEPWKCISFSCIPAIPDNQYCYLPSPHSCRMSGHLSATVTVIAQGNPEQQKARLNICGLRKGGISNYLLQTCPLSIIWVWCWFGAILGFQPNGTLRQNKMRQRLLSLLDQHAVFITRHFKMSQKIHQLFPQIYSLNPYWLLLTEISPFHSGPMLIFHYFMWHRCPKQQAE